jgi:hypothetical protein
VRGIILVIAGILGLWLAGNRQPAGWGLTVAAHLLWLPYALAAGQSASALAVAAFGPACATTAAAGGPPAYCKPGRDSAVSGRARAPTCSRRQPNRRGL